MNNLAKMTEVLVLARKTDTLLYEIGRDYRVSGFPNDNKHMTVSANRIILMLDTIRERCLAIRDEADKSPVTGKSW
jgi:hypothetical protein